jgi:predicted DNA-binding transcriptional regulator YafY
MPRNDKKSVLLRQWELLKLLPSRGPGATASALTEALNEAGYNISKRQVERDLNELMEVFTLDKDDRDIQYGWKWLHGASVDLPGMTISEALSLHMVENALKALMPVSMLEGLEARFSQAEKQLIALGKENRNVKWASKVRSVSPTMPFVPPVINSDMLATVHEALLSDVQIDVDYQAMSDEKSKPIRLSPLALVNRGAVSYLIATAYEYEEVRLYAMHRIRKATKTTDAIKRPPKFDLDEYIQAGNLHFGKGEPIRLNAWVLSKNLEKILEETPLSKDQKLTAKDDKVKLTATVADTDQLSWWLLSQASNIEVTAPVALRKKIGRLLAEAAKLYSNQAAEK